MSSRRPSRARLLWINALFGLLVGAGWLLAVTAQSAGQISAPQVATALTPGVVARMDSPLFRYSDGWRLSPQGADPTEPADPWNEPSGHLTFAYRGRELALQLAVGDYWGYLFVTVDGTPANRLAHISGNANSLGEAAGYKPLLAPEQRTADGAGEVWIPVHSGADDGPHTVTIEVWRGWGQIPIRGVAVDALPAPPLPSWPGVAFLLAGIWSLYFGLKNGTRIRASSADQWNAIREVPSAPIRAIRPIRVLFTSLHPRLIRLWPIALLAIGAGVLLDNWLLTDMGLALLALAALSRPELWVASLLFGLPFYLYPLPILPGRGLNLIEIGVWGGLVILAARWMFFQRRDAETQRRGEEKGKRQRGKAKVSVSTPPTQYAFRTIQSLPLALLVSLALLSAVASQETALALREWRTVFLAGGGFALLLGGVFALSNDPASSRRMLFNAWLLGGTVVALIALWQFASGQMIIQAEGVTRVRGLYGSPNNLALYLERTLAVGIAYCVVRITFSVRRRDYLSKRPEITSGKRPKNDSLSALILVASRKFAQLIFGQSLRHNTKYAILLIPQLAALVLTFSKGALFLGIPAMLLALGLGGAVLLARQGKSLGFLWWLAGIGGVVILGVLPFLETDRFRLLLDFGAGTTGGLRLSLWRSGWAMALDHPWLGVGPDNFLYAYRSGYILPAAWQDPNLNHPHNFVLDWWTRLGLPALLLAALWLGTGAHRLWRQLRSGSDAGLALGCLAAIAAALAHGLIDASFALPDLMLVWVLLLGVDKGRPEE